ncbi:hypothetical protein BDN70DRAFT_992058 [Pholiota conissans]|uniref:F-box domain-containing protein n=1 Tax=Pholiota conissans TaxID=109636 RepID=A0A9P5Z757_9AGAR|nr:hypothetical protein BDN70DRAFT_992058 [Pholiota conissans]
MRMLDEQNPPFPTTHGICSCTPCEELAFLDREISEAEEHFTTLKKKKRPALCYQRNRVHDPIISRLPVEIVSQIFTNFLPDTVDAAYTISRPGSSSTVTTPLLLGAVCKSWRAISWSTPQLWTSISIDIYIANDNFIDILREWLVKSGELPLYLAVTTSCYEDECDQIAERIVDLIAEYSSRWFFLKLEYSLGSFPLTYICSKISQASLLATLKIICDFRDHAIDFKLLRNLESLSMRYLEFKRLLNINWNRLTRIEGGIMLSLKLFFELFSQAVCLTHCTLALYDDHVSPNGNVHAPHPIIRHEVLVYLRFQSSRNRATEIALSKMEFPELQYLYGALLKANFIQDLIRRSSCKLKGLEVNPRFNNLDDEIQFINFLAGIPSLETLLIESRFHSSRSIDYLFMRLSTTTVICGDFPTPIFLPNLKTLSVRNIKWSWPYLLELLFEHTSNQSVLMPAPRSSEDSEAYPHVRPLHCVDLDLSEATSKCTLEPLVERKLRSTMEYSKIEVTITINYDEYTLPLQKFLKSPSLPI